MAEFKYTPISMIKENKQLSPVKLAVLYKYKSNGIHHTASSGGAGDTLALDISLYGIDKSGDQNLIAKCPLLTTADYKAGAYAAQVTVAIPVKDYPWIYYAYDSSFSSDFDKIISAQLFFEYRDYPDSLDTAVYTNAITM